jgi:hypothetical protein
MVPRLIANTTFSIVRPATSTPLAISGLHFSSRNELFSGAHVMPAPLTLPENVPEIV